MDIEHDMQTIKDGKVRNHKLGDSARKHSGKVERKECAVFCEFLLTKNFDFINSLRGGE